MRRSGPQGKRAQGGMAPPAEAAESSMGTGSADIREQSAEPHLVTLFSPCARRSRLPTREECAFVPHAPHATRSPGPAAAPTRFERPIALLPSLLFARHPFRLADFPDQTPQKGVFRGVAPGDRCLCRGAGGADLSSAEFAEARRVQGK